MGGELFWIMLSGALGGLAAAMVARAILPGKQRVTKIEMLAIGTAAGFLGGLIAGLVGLDDEKGWMRLIPFGISVALAAVVIYFWVEFRNRQVKQAIVPGPGRGSKDETSEGKGKGGPKSGGTGMPGPV